MNKEQKALIDKVKAELKELQNMNDVEDKHFEADKLLCELLVSFGMADVVEIYKDIEKWYA